TLVSAAIAQYLLGVYFPNLTALTPPILSAIIIAACLLILLLGKYRTLERTMKIVMTILLLSTLAAVMLALRDSTPRTIQEDAPPWWAAANFAFLLAFMGWMPIPIDSAIWNSIWVQEHERINNRETSLREALFDFRFGYILAGLVAILFLALGALVMRGRVDELQDGAGFVQQLIGTYADTLGRWSIPLIAIAALTTMLSTTLVVLDAFPRAMHRLTQAIRNTDPNPETKQRGYVFWVILQALVAMGIILFTLKSMKTMVDLATTLSFLTAPILALINYLVITRHAPKHARPGPGMRAWSIGSIVFLSAFSVAYLVWRFV
ncbi:MAG: divalent metal cation transporter, partial [bacterium]|nr:divalent metal cation transporter [bacterium]